jgi:selenocysteine-specific elongation factor
MKHVVAGTAGHIDHGKTALVKALTGIDADRLEEEKRRGITIDLGFAHLDLASGLRIGFVDVPGHERFVKNMLAGVGGIDLALFVVAADESIKPQTREHFDICRLLEIPRGVIALTKSDLADADMLGLVKLEVEELTAGSFLAGAPIVPVSSTTGAGIAPLKSELERVALSVPARDAGGHFRLPIDRVFSVKGFGTVVTGTLISGAVEKEQEVEVFPSSRRLRVRGVEVHGAQAARATAGQRTALNLAGIEPSGLKRGDVLAAPGIFRAVSQFDCRLQLLPSAKPLKHRAPVHFHSGTAETEAEVRLLSVESMKPAASMKPGQTAYARIVLRDPALLLPGDRFIIRMFSPVTTIGGGVVIDTGTPRYRKSDNIAARLDALSSTDAPRRVATLAGEARYGVALAELVARTGMTEAAIAAAAAKAPLAALTPPYYIDRAWFQAARVKLEKTVREFHAAHPLQPGIALHDLRNAELPGAPPFVLDALLAESKEIAVEGEIARLRGRKVTLRHDEQQARQALERAFETAGLATPSAAEALAQSGVEPARARELLQILLRERKLVRINAELILHHTAVAHLRELLVARRGARFQVPAFKEWTGVSRKYAIPLLEFLDRERVTRREGDERVVL